MAIDRVLLRILGAFVGVSRLFGLERLRCRIFLEGLRLFERLGLRFEGGEEVALVGYGMGAARSERANGGESEDGEKFHVGDGNTRPR